VEGRGVVALVCSVAAAFLLHKVATIRYLGCVQVFMPRQWVQRAARRLDWGSVTGIWRAGTTRSRPDPPQRPGRHTEGESMAALLNLCGKGDSCHETCASVARHVGACILKKRHT